jgi:hypothetical protein
MEMERSMLVAYAPEPSAYRDTPATEGSGTQHEHPLSRFK